MTEEQFEKKQSEMTDKVLLEKTKELLSKLCKTGGKSLSMSVPPNVNDFDMLVCELMKRYESLLKLNKKIIMIEYQNRYSQTDEPDKQGRWARTATYKNIRIAWISKVKTKDKIVFCASCHFPTMQNDIASESEVFFSLEDAKNFVSERWNFFLNAVS